ncbi:Pollen protein Ole e I like [Sesbania bispinosa]|nr:Pollen protein Ole e I like [Sesbania bispinosa]
MAFIHICFLVFMLASLLVQASFATGGGGDYGSKELDVKEKPKFEEEKLLSNNIAIQGLVYCKSGSKLIPLEEVAEKGVVKECRVFLDASPLDNCSYPTDVNKGISGSVLHSYRFLHDKKMKLYTVGPFLFTSPPKSISGYN